MKKNHNVYRLWIRSVAVSILVLFVYNFSAWPYSGGINLAVQSPFNPVSDLEIRDKAIIRYYLRCLEKTFNDFSFPVSDIRAFPCNEGINVRLGLDLPENKELESLFRDKEHERIITGTINNSIYHAYVTLDQEFNIARITIFTKKEFELVKKRGFISHGRIQGHVERKIDNAEQTFAVLDKFYSAALRTEERVFSPGIIDFEEIGYMKNNIYLDGVRDFVEYKIGELRRPVDALVMKNLKFGTEPEFFNIAEILYDKFFEGIIDPDKKMRAINVLKQGIMSTAVRDMLTRENIVIMRWWMHKGCIFVDIIDQKTEETELFGDKKIFADTFRLVDKQNNQIGWVGRIVFHADYKKLNTSFNDTTKLEFKQRYPARAVVKYRPLESVNFSYDEEQQKYIAKFWAINVERDREEYVTLYAKKALPETFEEYQKSGVENIDSALNQTLSAIGRDKRFIIEPAIYDIDMVGTKDCLAVAAHLANNKIARFHVIAHAAIDREQDQSSSKKSRLLKNIIEMFVPKDKKGTSPLDKYLNEKAVRYRIFADNVKGWKEFWQSHYALRMFQRKMWPEQDKELTHLKKLFTAVLKGADYRLNAGVIRFEEQGYKSKDLYIKGMAGFLKQETAVWSDTINTVILQNLKCLNKVNLTELARTVQNRFWNQDAKIGDIGRALKSAIEDAVVSGNKNNDNNIVVIKWWERDGRVNFDVIDQNIEDLGALESAPEVKYKYVIQDEEHNRIGRLSRLVFPAELIGRYRPVSEVRFVEKDPEKHTGVIMFTAYHVERPEEGLIEIKIEAQRAPSGTFEAYRITSDIGVNKMLLRRLKDIRKENRFVLGANPYLIDGFGTRKMIAIVKQFEKNSIVKFHKLALSAITTKVLENERGKSYFLEYLISKIREGNETGEQIVERYLEEKSRKLDVLEKSLHPWKKMWRVNYVLRLFQNREWKEGDIVRKTYKWFYSAAMKHKDKLFVPHVIYFSADKNYGKAGTVADLFYRELGDGKTRIDSVILQNLKLSRPMEVNTLAMKICDLIPFTLKQRSDAYFAVLAAIRNAVVWGNHNKDDNVVVIRWWKENGGLIVDVIDESVNEINFIERRESPRMMYDVNKYGANTRDGYLQGLGRYIDRAYLKDTETYTYDFPLKNSEGERIGQVLRLVFSPDYDKNDDFLKRRDSMISETAQAVVPRKRQKPGTSATYHLMALEPHPGLCKGYSLNMFKSAVLPGVADNTIRNAIETNTERGYLEKRKGEVSHNKVMRHEYRLTDAGRKRVGMISDIKNTSGRNAEKLAGALINVILNCKDEKILLALDTDLGKEGSAALVRHVIEDICKFDKNAAQILKNIEIISAKGPRLAEKVYKYTTQGYKGTKVKPSNVIMVTKDSNKKNCKGFSDEAVITFVDDSELHLMEYYPFVELTLFTLAKALYHRTDGQLYTLDELVSLYRSFGSEIQEDKGLIEICIGRRIFTVVLKPAERFEFDELQYIYENIRIFMRMA
ncbi:MAG: hypothetical protein ABH869_00610 [Candidatus Omnitrophota bacterium]